MALVGKIAIAMTATTKQLKKDLNEAGRILKSFESSVTSTGAIMGGFAAALATGAVAIAFKRSIEDASNLSENMNKLEATFGKASEGIVKQAELMNKGLGVSMSEFLDANSQIGGLFAGAGFDQDIAAGLSTLFAKLAGDASSLFNRSFEDSFRKIQSGLAGEAEPLREFGLFLSEDATKAYAFAHGLAKVGTELTNQQKVAARAMQIMEGLKRAHGDLLDQAAEYSNATREASGRFERLSEVIGQDLLPIATQFFGQVNVGLEALLLLWTDNREAVLGWAAGTVGSAEQAAGGMGIVQRAVMGIGDAIQYISNLWLRYQSFVSDGTAKLISSIQNLLSHVDSGDALGLQDAMATWADTAKEMADEARKNMETALAKPLASTAIADYFDKARANIAAARNELGKTDANTLKFGDLTGEKFKKQGKRDAFAEAAVSGSKEAASIILSSKYGKNAEASQTAKNTGETAKGVNRLVGVANQIAKALSATQDGGAVTLSSLNI